MKNIYDRLLFLVDCRRKKFLQFVILLIAFYNITLFLKSCTCETSIILVRDVFNEGPCIGSFGLYAFIGRCNV